VATKPNGFHADGGNLFLRVRDDSSVWIFRYKKAGKQISIGLSATHTRSLADAAHLAASMRNAIANGNDPADLVTQDKSNFMTFKGCALALIESKSPSWSNKKHVQQWSNTLAQYVYPSIGDKYPADVTLTDVKDILSPLWTTKTETANRVNIDKRVWTIPAERMKAKRDHSIPLCDEAIEILQTMMQWQMNNTELVFPGSRGGLVSDVAINKTLHTIAPNVTVHGFRSSFRVLGAETTSIPSAVLELALAHVNRNRVEAAYQRSDLFERRSELMNAWGDYCNGPGRILQLHREKIA
jgi:hypothetical protein